MMIPKIKLFITLCVGLFLVGCQQKRIEDKPSKPNIILLVADDLGYADLSIYRKLYGLDSVSESKTPNIDQLAARGMLFTDFHSGAPVCSPARAALLTGKNPSRLGIYNWIPSNSPMHLKSKEVTIAEVLQSQGYATGHFGKWHLSSEGMNQPTPRDQGFDYAFWTYNNAKPTHKNPINFIRNDTELGQLDGYSCYLVVNEAVEWLSSRQSEDKPFFLNLWFHEPHKKEDAPDSLLNRHLNKPKYYGSIENLDYAIGSLMSFLKDNGLDDNTHIIFTSDNGSQYTNSNAPFRGKKGLLYEGGIAVPLIAKWKGKIEEGAIMDFVGDFVDLLPTIASLVGSSVATIDKLDGIDFSKVLMGRKKEINRQKPLFYYRYFQDPICMLRMDSLVMLGYQRKPTVKQDWGGLRVQNLFDQIPGDTLGLHWSFNKMHMDSILRQRPKQFALYNLNEDKQQLNDISALYPDLYERLKEEMIQRQKAVIAEGGNWFEK